jgi:predicted nucleic acid-binding protein
MSQRILVDTDILIDVSNGITTAIARLASEVKTSVLAISIITNMELIIGCRNKSELQILERFLRHYEIIMINEPISNLSVNLLHDYRLSHGLAIPDAMIAATAITFNIPLLTKNQRDYRYIAGLNLLNYP